MLIRKWACRRLIASFEKTRLKMFLVIFLAVSATLSCAPFSKETMSRVDEGLTFDLVRRNPEQYKGKTVLWGGVIIETEIRPDEVQIVILQTALDMRKRPENLDRSEGRFIAKQSGYLDPAIYDRGREITVVGEVTGKEERPLGGIRYLYPVITMDRKVLWEKNVGNVIYFTDSWYREPYVPYMIR